MKNLVIGLAMATALVGSAAAADLPRRDYAPAPVAYAVAPVFTWTGLYVGVNGGYSFNGKGTLESVSYKGSTYSLAGYSDRSVDLDGFTLGGTVGYNLQFGNVVVGVEGDLNWANIEGSRDLGGYANISQKVDYFGTARVRLGYAFDRVLPYVTGGAIWQHSKANVNVPFIPFSTSASDSNFGWTIGAGVEYAFSNNWSVKGEYLYARVKDTNYSFATPYGVVGANVKNEQHIVRTGLNYRF